MTTKILCFALLKFVNTRDLNCHYFVLLFWLTWTFAFSFKLILWITPNIHVHVHVLYNSQYMCTCMYLFACVFLCMLARAVCVLFSLIFISLFVRVAAAAASNQHCFDLAAVPATDWLIIIHWLWCMLNIAGWRVLSLFSGTARYVCDCVPAILKHCTVKQPELGNTRMQSSNSRRISFCVHEMCNCKRH